jgi:mRNA interferase HigB
VGFNVIAKPALRAFWERHADSREALEAWYKLLSKSDFENFAFKQVFGSADFIQPDYVVFNIKGNKYRVIARISFHYKRVWIKHVFTHAEYDRWRP